MSVKRGRADKVVRIQSIQWVLALLLTGAMVSFSTEAQVLYGSIVGNVTDDSGAVVPGATVKITNRGTNQVREALTTTEGGFNFPTVQAGNWEVTVSKQGFKSVTRTGVLVTLNSLARSDIQLEVGNVAESISVTADAVLLQTDRAEVRAELTSRELTNLPIPAGRNYQNLFRSLPGITPPDNAHSVPSNPSRALIYNVNGTSASSNNVRIDGASQYNIFLPHVTAYVPALEAIETVNVVTNNFDAEQGLAGGAAVNVQIKSGTNQFRGSAFEYHDNNHTKAKPWILPPTEDKPKRVYNQYGGTLGGPIIKNKLFFFGSFEATSDRQLGTRFLTLPTAEMRNGILSGGAVRVFDPATGDLIGRNRDEFAGAVIPASRIDPTARKILQDLPLPNIAGRTGTNIANNYYATAPYSFDRKTFDTKINWNITDKLTSYGRFSVLSYKQLNPGALGKLDGVGTAPQGGNTGVGSGETYGVTVAGVYTFSPNFIVDANIGYTRQGTNSEQGFLDQKIGLDVLGIPGTNGPRAFENGWPRFAISGFANLGVQDSFMPYYRNDPQWQYVTNFNWTRGSHNVRFGFDFARQILNHQQVEFIGGAAQPASGGFNFGSGPTQLCEAGNAAGTACSRFTPSNLYNAFGTFLLGYTTGHGRTLLIDDTIIFKAQAYSFYVRDQWQVNSKLTVTAGTRWEYYPMPVREDRGIERYDFNTNQMIVCGVGNVPNDCGVKQSKRLFSPRVGVAWRISDSFVLRTGYGVTWDPISLARIFRTNFPMLIALNVPAPNSAQPSGTLRTGIPQVPVPNFSSGRVTPPGEVSLTTLGDRFDRPYIQSWNVVLEKSLWNGLVASAGYVATRTIRQAAYLNVNAGLIGGGPASQPLNQRFGRQAGTTIYGPVGNSMYDSLQVNVKRRFANGLQLQGNYTWSKAIGLVGVGGQSENSVNLPRPEYYAFNRSLLNFDIPHNFQFTGAYELPFGRGRRWLANNKAASALAGGWQMNWVFGAFMGTPFSLTASGTSINAPGISQRPDQIGQVVKLNKKGRNEHYYDPNVFRPVDFDPNPANTVRFGTLGFNTLRGPGTVNLDLGLFREFQIRERIKLQFRVEAFNATNTPHFANPGNNASAPARETNRSSPNFGQILTDPVTGRLRTNGFMEITGVRSFGREGIDERVVRFGLRLSF
jgi:hypothetical protein